MKIAPVTRIRDLVQLQLPGIGLRTMPAAPRQIPYHAGYTYFELEKGGDLWKQMEKSSAFALHGRRIPGAGHGILGDSQPYGPVTYDSENSMAPAPIRWWTPPTRC